MSSSDRRVFLVGAALAALSACGFTPVYGPGGTAEGLRGRIATQEPNNQSSFDLVEQLERRLGQPVAAQYLLETQISLSEQSLGVTIEAEITRINVVGSVNFALRDTETGTIVTSGTVQNFTSFSTTGTPFATQTARRDAYKRLLVILADGVVNRLLVTSESWLT